MSHLALGGVIPRVVCRLVVFLLRVVVVRVVRVVRVLDWQLTHCRLAPARRSPWWRRAWCICRRRTLWSSSRCTFASSRGCTFGAGRSLHGCCLLRVRLFSLRCAFSLRCWPCWMCEELGGGLPRLLRLICLPGFSSFRYRGSRRRAACFARHPKPASVSISVSAQQQRSPHSAVHGQADTISHDRLLATYDA